METDTATDITSLLLEAEQAHGVYESIELNGVYDQDWPRWYAAYVIEHGLADVVGHATPLDRVTMVLESAYAEFDRADPKPADSWAEHLGRRMAAELAT
jgi:hypothetical protein